MSAILEVRDLVKEYPGVRAVAGVSFTVAAGSCFGLLGPNGAGKTTTVEMMEGICRPTAGAVLYRGEAQGAQFRAEAGIQFQSTALQDFLTVRETLVLFDERTGPTLIPAPRFYAGLRAVPAFAGSELNLEGALVRGDELLLFQRGNIQMIGTDGGTAHKTQLAVLDQFSIDLGYRAHQ